MGLEEEIHGEFQALFETAATWLPLMLMSLSPDHSKILPPWSVLKHQESGNLEWKLKFHLGTFSLMYILLWKMCSTVLLQGTALVFANSREKHCLLSSSPLPGSNRGHWKVYWIVSQKIWILTLLVWPRKIPFLDIHFLHFIKSNCWTRL